MAPAPCHFGGYRSLCGAWGRLAGVREKPAGEKERMDYGKSTNGDPSTAGGKTARADRVRLAVQWLAILIGGVLTLSVTIAVTVLRPDRPVRTVEELEGRAHLQRIYDAQERSLRKTGSFAGSLEELRVPDSTENFDYTLFFNEESGTFTAYAMWKNPSTKARRFLRLDGSGRIRRVGRHRTEQPAIPE